MATSSIRENVVISDPAKIEEILDALNTPSVRVRNDAIKLPEEPTDKEIRAWSNALKKS